MTNETKGLSAPAARAADIFRRYPAVSPDEEREALTFLKTGRHLDIGLVTGNPDLAANIAVFRDAHAGALTPGFGANLAFTLIFLLAVGIPIAMLMR
ncbi:MAG: hypothetical protein JNL35_17340 [Sphingopyxis sp.]|nr:hypothetical protein [Sphingopyxis sp.]